jgi:hypothetical protein
MPRRGGRPPKRARQPDDMVRTNTFLRQPFPARSNTLHLSHFPKHPTAQLRAHYPIKTACMRTCAVPTSTSTSTRMPRLHLHTSWFPAHQSTCTPHAMQSRSQLREDEKRQRLEKGFLRGACSSDDGWYRRRRRCSHLAQRIGRLQTRWIFFSIAPHTHSSTPLRFVSISRSLERLYHVCESQANVFLQWIL